MKKIQNLVNDIVTKWCKSPEDVISFKIASEWANITGDRFANVTKLKNIKNNYNGMIAVISVKNTGFIGELSMYENMLLDRINVYYGYKAVYKIVFVMDHGCYKQ